MTYVYTLQCIRVTIFINGSIIPPGFKFTELHTLTLAARSYVLLVQCMEVFHTCIKYQWTMGTICTKRFVLNSEVFLFQECPVREVPLYLIINPLALLCDRHALLEMSCKISKNHRSCLNEKKFLHTPKKIHSP